VGSDRQLGTGSATMAVVCHVSVSHPNHPGDEGDHGARRGYVGVAVDGAVLLADPDVCARGCGRAAVVADRVVDRAHAGDDLCDSDCRGEDLPGGYPDVRKAADFARDHEMAEVRLNCN